MPLIRTEKGFAIEYDVKLLEDKPARLMDIAGEYHSFFETILYTIAALANDDSDRSTEIYELTKLLEMALPNSDQFEAMFKQITLTELEQ